MQPQPIESKSGSYIRDQEKQRLLDFSQFLSKTRTLKIGNGLGHLSESIRPMTQELTILDIQTYPKTINSNRVQIYSGYPIPYPDKTFDTTIIVFTLHHIPKNRQYFKEILRVTKRRVIIFEETYDNVFQKIHLFMRDWWVNRDAGQSTNLYWNSYFSRKEIRELIKRTGLKEVFTFTKPHKSYFKELFVLDIN